MAEAKNEVWSIDKLKLWDKNPRSISDKDFDRLKRQIQKLGTYKPLVVNEDGVVLGGNMRLRALQELGESKVWVSIVDAKDEATMLEYALSDNDRAGEYDEQQLAELVTTTDIELDLYKVDLGKVTDLPDLIDKYGPDAEEDEPPEVDESNVVSKLGEVYELGKHRLMCGDATKKEDVDKLMAGAKADMVFTDPPYGIAYEHDNRPAKRPHKFDKLQNDDINLKDLLPATFENMASVIKDGAVYYCWHSGKTQREFQDYLEKAGFIISTTIIWAKGHFSFSRQDYHPQHEPCFYGWKEGVKHQFYGSRNQSTLWSELYDSGNVTAGHNTVHPTQKPLKLGVKAIKNSSKSGDIVLDLFGGSGSTLISCEQTDRNCYMMEIDPKYCDVIRKRYAKFIDKEEQWQEVTPLADQPS